MSKEYYLVRLGDKKYVAKRLQGRIPFSSLYENTHTAMEIFEAGDLGASTWWMASEAIVKKLPSCKLMRLVYV